MDRRFVRRSRPGHMLALLAVLLPAVFGLLALAIDASLLMTAHRQAQNIADAAATAGAVEIRRGETAAVAQATAVSIVQDANQLTDADVTVNVPPDSGPYAGRSDYVEVNVRRTLSTFFAHITGHDAFNSVEARAVAGAEPSTAGAAIVVLDPSPSPATVSAASLPSLSVPPNSVGGLEVLGLGAVRIHGAVLVNTEWGGVDEDGEPAGTSAGPPWGATCMPLLPLTRLRATDLRVVGGVDNPSNYGSITAGDASPLMAGQLPVPDPFRQLPAPTTGADPANVSSESFGHVTVTGLPLVGQVRTLQPGVYESLQIVSGRAELLPGVYIIRGKHPLTQVSLSVLGGQVTANGVMFYVTDSAAYDPQSGLPDSTDYETEPAETTAPELVPSVVINSALLGSTFTPLNDPGSPFQGMLVYQRRQDRRPIVVLGNVLVPNGTFSGSLYAKWGQVLFAGQGTYDVRMVAGTVRFVNVLDCTIQPSQLLPPAKDVFLVE